MNAASRLTSVGPASSEPEVLRCFPQLCTGNSRAFRLSAGLCLLSLSLLSLPGCGGQAQIKTYRTEKPESVQARNHTEPQADDAPAVTRPVPARPEMTAPPAGQPVRMFAAIVPQGEQTWFYKVTGPVEMVAEQVETLANFIASVQYQDGKPQWELPSGWEQQPGNQFRFATLLIPSEPKPLEFSVTTLSGSADPVSQAVDNINRWRGQVGLGPITAAQVEQATSELSAETSVRQSAGSTIYFVNLEGVESASGRMPPFAR